MYDLLVWLFNNYSLGPLIYNGCFIRLATERVPMSAEYTHSAFLCLVLGMCLVVVVCVRARVCVSQREKQEQFFVGVSSSFFCILFYEDYEEEVA